MTPDQVNRKLVAILSADVKGYIRLMGEDEEWTLSVYKEVITGSIKHHRGGNDSKTYLIMDFA